MLITIHSLKNHSLFFTRGKNPVVENRCCVLCLKRKITSIKINSRFCNFLRFCGRTMLKFVDILCEHKHKQGFYCNILEFIKLRIVLIDLLFTSTVRRITIIWTTWNTTGYKLIFVVNRTKSHFPIFYVVGIGIIVFGGKFPIYTVSPVLIFSDSL